VAMCNTAILSVPEEIVGSTHSDSWAIMCVSIHISNGIACVVRVFTWEDALGDNTDRSVARLRRVPQVMCPT
jgi:hypothetical protein